MLGVILTLVAAGMYYVPAHPQAPEPATGSIYPKELHGTVVYWKKAEVIAHRIISISAISSFGAGFLILWRLGLMGRRA